MSKISELSDGGVIQGGDTLIAVRSGGNVKVTYGGSTTANIDGGTIDGTTIGGTTPAAGSFTTGSFTGNVSFGDNDKAIFGAGSDLEIYHTGAASYIEEKGTGSLYILGTQLRIQATDGTGYIEADDGGAVTLKYNGSNKMATTTTGIDVTGTATMDAIVIEPSDAQLQFNAVAYKIKGGGNYGDLRFEAPRFRFYESNNLALQIDNGDISFYESTGTTPKFFWDSSAEALGIGSTDPQADALGSADDLVIKNAASAGLTIKSADSGNQTIALGASSDEDYAIIQGYYNSGSPFVRTSISGAEVTKVTSSGIDVTGSISADGLTVEGADSVGIDDYILHNGDNNTKFGFSGADTFKIRTGGQDAVYVDSNQNLLVGTTNSSIAGANLTGVVLVPDGASQFSRDGGHALDVNRKQDGEIVRFRSAGTPVGSIGVQGDRIYLAGANEAVGIDDSWNAFVPLSTGGGNSNADTDLGNPSSKFKDLYLSGTANVGGLTVDGNATITTADNSDTLVLVSTDADANVGPVLSLYRNSASPADNDVLGRIIFKGEDDAGNSATFALIDAIATDITNGSEDGRLDFKVANNDTFNTALSISGSNVGIGDLTPSQKLDVNGNVRVTGGYIEFAGDTSTPSAAASMHRPADNTLAFVTANTERMRINSSGHVLVGTTDAGIYDDATDEGGHNLLANGQYFNSTASEINMILNRQNSDGDIIQFRRDGTTTVGSIGTIGGDVYFGSSSGSGSALRFDGANNLIYASNASGSARDAALDLGSSSVRFKDLYLSGGAYLGGTGSANHLDDYEEGTFTPSWQASTTTVTVNHATYTKVGRMVTVNFYISNIAPATSSDTQYIQGLPFTVASGHYPVGSIGYSVLADTAHLGVLAGAGTQNIYFHEIDGTSVSALTRNDWNSLLGSGLALIISLTYMTT